MKIKNRAVKMGMGVSAVLAVGALGGGLAVAAASPGVTVSGACTGAAPFTDVSVNNPFCQDIKFLKDKGIANGSPDGTFKPTAPTSRQAMAAYLHRLYGVVDTSASVTDLTGTFVDHSGTGTSAVTAKGVELSGTGADSYAGISTDALNNLTPADLSTISYTESYTADGVNAEPYFKLKLQPAGGACGDADVLYAPDAQSPTLSYPGETQTFSVTAPYSTVGVNNDAQPTDGNYATAIHSTSNGAEADVSGDSICLAEIIFDGGSGASGGTATINDITFAGAGLPSKTYVFGS